MTGYPQLLQKIALKARLIGASGVYGHEFASEFEKQTRVQDGAI